MRRLGEKRWEDTESFWQKKGVSLQDVQKVSGWLLEKMICWTVWQRVLFLLASSAVVVFLELFFISQSQKAFPHLVFSHLIVALGGLGFFFSNSLFLFWLSTFPKWELEKRKKLANRFTAITFFIVLLLLGINIFLTMAHLK